MTQKTLLQEDWDKIGNSFALQEEFCSRRILLKIFRYTSVDGIKEQIEETPVGKCVFFMDYSYNEPKINKCEVIEVSR